MISSILYLSLSVLGLWWVYEPNWTPKTYSKLEHIWEKPSEVAGLNLFHGEAEHPFWLNIFWNKTRMAISLKMIDIFIYYINSKIIKTCNHESTQNQENVNLLYTSLEMINIMQPSIYSALSTQLFGTVLHLPLHPRRRWSCGRSPSGQAPIPDLMATGKS